jgi:hypothetical protein
MNQVAEALRQTFNGFLAVAVFWHLYLAIKWLIEKDCKRKIQQIGTKPKGSAFRNEPLDPD